MDEYGPEQRERRRSLHQIAGDAAESVWLKLLARWGMIVTSVSIMLGSWIGSQVWESYNRNNQEINKKLDDVTRVAGEIRVIHAQIEGDRASNTGRFNAHADRLGRVETRIDTVEQRLYNMKDK